METKQRILEALEVAMKYGSVDGAHHKMWVIDQIVRILAGENYNIWIEDFCRGEDGENTYEWDCGIAP